VLVAVDTDMDFRSPVIAKENQLTAHGTENPSIPARKTKQFPTTFGDSGQFKVAERLRPGCVFLVSLGLKFHRYAGCRISGRESRKIAFREKISLRPIFTALRHLINDL
jgi:hypothetical protein